MKKFLVIYHNPTEALPATSKPSPEEHAASMAPWFAWKTQHDSNIVDFGAPVGQGQHVSSETDWTSSDKAVGGYSIVQSSDADSVREMFKDHPHLAWAPGTSIEVHEFMPM